MNVKEIEKASCGMLASQLYIQAIFQVIFRGIPYRCRMNILAKSPKLEDTTLEIHLLSEKKYSYIEYESVFLSMEEEKQNLFIQVRSLLMETILEEIQYDRNWEQYRLEILCW